MTPITLSSTKLEVKYTANWKVVLSMPVYTELMHYVSGFDTECSGAGLVRLEITGDTYTFVVYEVFLPEKQKNTGGTTDIESDEVGRLVTKIVRAGKKPEDLRCHWHSHNTMSVFHSGTDEDNYKVLKTGEYLVSLVLNKAGEIKASVHYYKPFALTAENIPVTVMLDEIAVSPEWDENIKKVKAYDKPKVVESTFKKWDEHKYEGYSGCNGYSGRDWEKERETHAAQSLEAMQNFLLINDYYEPLEEPHCRWEEAECTVIDTLTNRVVRISIDVEDLREATPDEMIEDNQQKGVQDYGSV